ncbi:MAG TPA: long-chain fatty acid--CoA ligase [Bryobacteraceae bacterium]|nr:long-chain fatty acid--CoA ligase [Bryobacteraceae bacterium]
MLYSITLQHAARYSPANPAIVRDSGSTTYAELAIRVDSLAAEFLSHGVGAGDRLAVLLPNGAEFIEILYACARLGIIAVPLNTRYAAAEIDAILSDCSPKGMLRHSTLPAPSVRTPWEVVIDEQPLLGAEGELPPPFYDPAAIFGLFYTSGTTGRAKGVMLTHQSLFANTQNCLPYFSMRKDSCYLHAAPMFHLADFPGLLCTVALGACQTTIPRFELQLFCAAVQRYRVTHCVLIPTMINFLTLYPELNSFDLSSLQWVLYGGSPIAPEVLRRARAKLSGTRFTQGYGLTEASPVLTLLLDEDHTPERALSCGRPPFGVELRIAGPDGETVKRGESGELTARGLNIMKGYWNQPEATQYALRDGWLYTGDICQQDEDGFYYIVDRAKDMIVTGGENVYSTEVEAALYGHPAIKEAAVIGIPDPQWGELVTACIVLKDGSTATVEDLAAHCRELIANYKVPRRIEFYERELPKSGTGKILKRTLREPFWQGRARGVS